MELLTELSFDLWSLLLLIGCLHGGFLSIILIFSRHRLQIVLGLLILIWSYSLFIAFLWQSQLMVYLPHLVATSMPTLYLLGPLYYWFFSGVATDQKKISWVHFIPALICALTIGPFYFQGLDLKMEYILSRDTGVVDLPPTRAIYFGLWFLHLCIYWLLSHRLYRPVFHPDGRKHRQVRKFDRWLKAFHYSFGFFMIVFLLTYLILTLTPVNHGGVRYAAQLSLALLVHLVGYYTLKDSALLTDFKYRKTLTADTLLKKQILNLMTIDKPYLDKDLTVSRLAEYLEVSPATLSKVINADFQCSFSDFINKYRVDEAKRLLVDKNYQHYKLAAIGEEAGFSNKVSFNRVFKKHTGFTPSTLRLGQHSE